LSPISKLSAHSQTGFSLVEIMVGLVIGILGVIVMLQVFALSEERKRTTTSTGESQSDGVIALYQLQRDIGQAGYGFTALNLFNCTLTAPVGAASIPLVPVIINPPTSIIPAADANSDTLLVSYGNTNGQPQGNPIAAQAGTLYTVQMPSTFTVGDRVIAAPTACTANLILDSVTASTSTLTVATGAAGANLYNLGPGPRILAYAVRNGNLTACDYAVNNCSTTASAADPSKWVPIASNIISLKAQYGLDTLTAVSTADAFAKVDSYNQTTPSGTGAACSWTRVPAVRMALVARSNQYDKALITAVAPAWAGGSINLSAFADWQHYRYKVFQAVVPIRNVAWMGVPAGC
jgi:type IV pilus assembly protein PilW